MRDLKQTFNAVYREPIGEDDQLWYGSQTATVMALRFGLVPEEVVKNVVDGLVYDIKS